MRIQERKLSDNFGLCDLCGHEETIQGRMLCLICQEAITRLAYAAGVRASPSLTGSGGECRELLNVMENKVRTHIGNYAYEVKKEHCAGKEGRAHWAYAVYRVSPNDEALVSKGGNSPCQEHAERNALQIIALYSELDGTKPSELSGFNDARS